MERISSVGSFRAFEYLTGLDRVPSVGSLTKLMEATDAQPIQSAHNPNLGAYSNNQLSLNASATRQSMQDIQNQQQQQQPMQSGMQSLLPRTSSNSNLQQQQFPFQSNPFSSGQLPRSSSLMNIFASSPYNPASTTKGISSQQSIAAANSNSALANPLQRTASIPNLGSLPRMPSYSLLQRELDRIGSASNLLALSNNNNNNSINMQVMSAGSASHPLLDQLPRTTSALNLAMAAAAASPMPVSAHSGVPGGTQALSSLMSQFNTTNPQINQNMPFTDLTKTTNSGMENVTCYPNFFSFRAMLDKSSPLQDPSGPQERKEISDPFTPNLSPSLSRNLLAHSLSTTGLVSLNPADLSYHNISTAAIAMPNIDDRARLFESNSVLGLLPPVAASGMTNASTVMTKDSYNADSTLEQIDQLRSELRLTEDLGYIKKKVLIKPTEKEEKSKMRNPINGQFLPRDRSDKAELDKLEKKARSRKRRHVIILDRLKKQVTRLSARALTLRKLCDAHCKDQRILIEENRRFRNENEIFKSQISIVSSIKNSGLGFGGSRNNTKS